MHALLYALHMLARFWRTHGGKISALLLLIPWPSLWGRRLARPWC